MVLAAQAFRECAPWLHGVRVIFAVHDLDCRTTRSQPARIGHDPFKDGGPLQLYDAARQKKKSPRSARAGEKIGCYCQPFGIFPEPRQVGQRMTLPLLSLISLAPRQCVQVGRSKCPLISGMRSIPASSNQLGERARQIGRALRIATGDTLPKVAERVNHL